MELGQALRRRRMVRSFDGRPVDEAAVQRILAAARRAPTAGNSRGTAWLVLEGVATDRYWSRATTEDWRARSRRWEGLRRAPVVVLSLASPAAYVARYAEPDKAGGPPPPAGGPALGRSTGEWPVPYWFGDAAFAAMSMLLAAVDEGLGGCFLGNFRGEGEILAGLGVPPTWRLFGAVLLGHPDGANHPSASLDRSGPGDAERVHRGRW